MTDKDLADLLVALFDPLLTLEEKSDLLEQCAASSAEGFDQAGVLTMNEGVVLSFADGATFQLAIIQCGR